MNAEFQEGDLALLIDNKKRRYLVKLDAKREFQSHAGVLSHSQIIGQPEGLTAATTRGQKFRVFRPTLEDYVLNMPRGAQVIYPKDLGPIMVLADIAPGDRVFESGVGSGATSTVMLRGGAHITGYEIREDFADRAKENVVGFLGEAVLDRYDVQIRSAYDGIDHPEPFDRAILDLPEPWQVVPHLATAMRPGGIVVAYTPSITQVAQLRAAFEDLPFTEERTVEVLNRTWHVEGQAVRPDHRMVAHTGFLTRARLGLELA